jgi:Na+-transporting NADH:ubiquinone oxidoreductase subunit NqrE
MMQIRVQLGIFSGLVLLICALLAPVAFLVDKNVQWGNRLLWIALVAGLIFLGVWLV